MAETMAKSSDELANNQDKMDHLNDVKAKLEKTLDQMDGALESELRKFLDLNIKFNSEF